MVLQSSGPISLLNVQNEFGGSNPISITEYYGVDSGVPSSGTISLSNFYGKSSTPFLPLVFGYSDTTSTTNNTNTYTGGPVAPGGSQSPKTFRVYLVAPSYFYGAGGMGYVNLQYYLNGSLTTTFTTGSSQFYDVNYTFYFGASAMRFSSTIYDPYSYTDVYGYATLQWSTSQGAPSFRTLYSHTYNLVGGGRWN